MDDPVTVRFPPRERAMLEEMRQALKLNKTQFMLFAVREIYEVFKTSDSPSADAPAKVKPNVKELHHEYQDKRS